MARALAVAVSLALSCVASPAAAQSRVCEVEGPFVGPPEASLRVEEEVVSIVCREEVRSEVWAALREPVPVCAFETRYGIRTDAADRQQALIRFQGIGTRKLSMTVDGATRAPSDEERVLLGMLAGLEVGKEHAAARITTEPGSRHEIVLTGESELASRITAPIYARHLLFSPRFGKHVYAFRYPLWTRGKLQGNPRIRVEVTYPAGYRAKLNGGVLGWRESRRGAAVVLSRSFQASEREALEIELEPPAVVVGNRGVLLGLGRSLGVLGEPGRVRGRIGYEVAAPDWLMYSLTADTDFNRRFIVTPLVEAATPSDIGGCFGLLPSLGVGAGAPIQIGPDVRAGVRLQGDLHFMFLGFVTSVDIYPRMGDAKPGFVEASFLAQIGL